ncbi:hypothetical protein B2G51_04055 [Leptospira santarosai]|nr:hypothetical protein B2G51_04055 [Leptospira santarosai]
MRSDLRARSFSRFLFDFTNSNSWLSFSEDEEILCFFDLCCSLFRFQFIRCGGGPAGIVSFP